MTVTGSMSMKHWLMKFKGSLIGWFKFNESLYWPIQVQWKCESVPKQRKSNADSNSKEKVEKMNNNLVDSEKTQGGRCSFRPAEGALMMSPWVLATSSRVQRPVLWGWTQLQIPSFPYPKSLNDAHEKLRWKCLCCSFWNKICDLGKKKINMTS